MTTTVHAQKGISYKAVITGVRDKGLIAELQSISDTFTLKNRPPATISLLRHRAKGDGTRFDKLLRARGYYSARIDVAVNTKTEPVLVTFHIRTGPVYVIESVVTTVQSVPKSVQRGLPAPARLGLQAGQPARAKTIVDAGNTLLKDLQNKGFPFPRMVERRVVVDHRTHKVAVTFRIDPGPPARFGKTSFNGLKAVREDYLRAKIPWRKGQPYDAALLPKLQQKLTRTGLFALVRILPAEHLDQDGALPITVQVVERKRHTVRAGANYSTDEGVAGHLSWENRNLLHRGEQLSFGLTASQIALAAAADFKKAEFLEENQTLLADFRLADDTTDVYTSRNMESNVSIERNLTRQMRVGTGLGFRLSSVDQLNTTEEFVLLSVPSRLGWDTSNNLLDPTRGGRFNLQLAPYYDLRRGDLGFVKGFLEYRHYFKLFTTPLVVFAGRLGVGSIAGPARSRIPADLRFYAGGGGSIRGYPYQEVGPTENGNPVGGRSLFLVSGELRFKVTQTIGFVTFVDGGNAYTSSYPNFAEPLRWGAGTGLRYYTPIGPARLDIALPLNRPDYIDAKYQIYISIGQAF